MTPEAKHRQIELAEIAKRVNELELEIQASGAQLISGASDFSCRVIEAGQQLIQAKLRCPAGAWGDWLASHVRVSERTAQVYMRIAANPERASGARSIREALKLLDADPAGAESGPRPRTCLLPDLDALGRIAKLRAFVSRHPVDTWRAEARERARSEFEPMARALWPEKFIDQAP